LRQPAFEEVASLFRQFIAVAGNGHGAPGIPRVLQQHTGKSVRSPVTAIHKGDVEVAPPVLAGRPPIAVPDRGPGWLAVSVKGEPFSQLVRPLCPGYLPSLLSP
jgi:hypothetical protein